MLLCEVGDPGLNAHWDHHTQWCENENDSINMGESKLHAGQYSLSTRTVLMLPAALYFSIVGHKYAVI